MGPDIQVISPPDPTPHSAHEFGEHIEAQVERSHRGNFAIGGGIDDVETGVGQVAGRSFWFLDERDDPSLSVQLGDPAGAGVGGTEQDHGQWIAVLAVKCEQGPQVDVAEIIGVDDHNFIGTLGQIGIGGHRAGRAQ